MTCNTVQDDLLVRINFGQYKIHSTHAHWHVASKIGNRKSANCMQFFGENHQIKISPTFHLAQ